MVTCSLPMKSRKRLACDVFDTFATTMVIRSLPMKSRKKMARDVFDNFAIHTTFFMMSLRETAGHKITALTVEIFATFKP